MQHSGVSKTKYLKRSWSFSMDAASGILRITQNSYWYCNSNFEGVYLASYNLNKQLWLLSLLLKLLIFFKVFLVWILLGSLVKVWLTTILKDNNADTTRNINVLVLEKKWNYLNVVLFYNFSLIDHWRYSP